MPNPISSRLASLLGAVLAVSLIAAPALAAIMPFPSDIQIEELKVDGATLHVRVGGHGPAVLMLHGFGDTGDMWSPLVKKLVKDHTVIVPDLRGMGLSSHPATGYDKKSQAQDLAQVLDRLKIGQVDLVTHDIGNMVGYAFAAQYPSRVTRWAVMDAPLPGIGEIWEKQLSNPKTWHFNFRGPDEERLVKGRERIFLDRFYNELSATPARIDEGTRQHYAALYARPGAMHSAFEQFAAFSQDAIDNQQLEAKGKLAMPILAVGGDKSYGSTMAEVMRQVATDVTPAVIENSGHWLMEEQPEATVTVLMNFLEGPRSGGEQQARLTPAEIATLPAGGAGAGTSGLPGITTVTLSGDPMKAGPYTQLIKVPPHTTIAAHSHRDDRSASVISGTWYFGYGPTADFSNVKALPPGSFYTEPGGQPHFARTTDEAVVVYITGYGPTSTVYVDPANNPQTKLAARSVH